MKYLSILLSLMLLLSFVGCDKAKETATVEGAGEAVEEVVEEAVEGAGEAVEEVVEEVTDH